MNDQLDGKIAIAFGSNQTMPKVNLVKTVYYSIAIANRRRIAADEEATACEGQK